MKRLMSLLLTAIIILAIFSTLTVNAETEVKSIPIDGGKLNYIENDSGGVIIRGIDLNDGVTAVTLPGIVDGKPVTAISEYTFIGTEIEEITLGDGFEVLGEKAISHSDKIRKINFGNVKKIKPNAVYECFNLQSITLPATLEKFGEGAFRGTYSMKKIKIDSNNPYYTSKDGILFNKKLTTLYCYPAGKTAKTYKVPDSVKRIKTKAFYFNKYLEKITLSKSIQVPEVGAVTECSSLKTVDLGDGMKIWENCFVKECDSIERVIIGNKVEKTDTKKIFSDLTLMDRGFITEYVVRSGNQNFTTKNGVLYNKTMTRIFRYAGSRKTKKFQIPDSVKIVEACAFKGATQLEFVYLGKKTYKIKYASFMDTIHLLSTDIPKKQTEIPEKCFFNSRIGDLHISNNVKTIGAQAFAKCDELDLATLGKNVTTVKTEAFLDCKELKSIKIPKSVKTIGTRAFGFYSDWDCDDNGIEIPAFSHVDMTITGYKGSAAEKYAKKNGLKFKAIK